MIQPGPLESALIEALEMQGKEVTREYLAMRLILMAGAVLIATKSKDPNTMDDAAAFILMMDENGEQLSGNMVLQ